MSTFSGTECPVTVGYWGIRGLAAALRMMVMYNDTPLVVENYDLVLDAEGHMSDSQWTTHKEALRPRNALINLPYIIDGDVVISQTNACFTYLGRKLNQLGASPIETTQCEQLLCEAMDLRNKMVGYFYSPNGEASKFLEGLTNLKYGHLRKFNDWLSTKDDVTFFVGSSASAPDFHIWELIDQLNSMALFYNVPSPVSGFPKLVEFHSLFKALPNNAKYFSTPKLCNLPANNLSAKGWGATPSGHSWDDYKQKNGLTSPDAARPWNNSNGTY